MCVNRKLLRMKSTAIQENNRNFKKNSFIPKICSDLAPYQIRNISCIELYCSARPSGLAKYYHQSELSVLITSQLRIKLIPEMNGTAIRREKICRDSLIRNVRYWKRLCLSLQLFLKFCKAVRAWLGRKSYVTRLLIKRAVFLSLSYRCVSSRSQRSKQHLKVCAAQIGLHNCNTFKEQKFNKLQ